MPSTIFENVICANCREREAVVFLRRSDGHSSGDFALCEACARSRGIVAGKGHLELSLDDLIGDGDRDGKPSPELRACPSCGLALPELRRDGRLGCSSCADAFRAEIVRTLGVALGAAQGAARSRGDGDETRSPAETDAAGMGDTRATADLERRLADALAAEDYETAAGLRDKIARLSEGEADPSRSAAEFPVDARTLVDATAAESDVVLWTAARSCRDLEGVPFPGGASCPADSRLAARLPSSDGWLRRTMAELGPCGRRSLAERGLVARSYAADDDALLLSRASDSAYILLGEGDHFRSKSLRPGLDPQGALRASEGIALAAAPGEGFASRPGIGWICSAISDCGRGYSLSAVVHLPALAAAGLVDRLLKALMAEGATIRGLYSSSEGSAGSLYEIAMEGSSPVDDPVSALTAAARAAASAERRARLELVDREKDFLLDAEGRAFGILERCRLLGADEAASLLSSLRMAALRGALKGIEAADLGALLVSLGPGSIGLAAGRDALPASEEQDSLRASVVKAALSNAEYRPEEAARCSRD